MKKLILGFILIIAAVLLSGCEIGNNGIEVKLLYSSSGINANVKTVIDNYDEYLEREYDLDLTSDFFNDSLIYTYVFQNNNLGEKLYDLDSYQLLNERLEIKMKNSDDFTNKWVSPAFGPYVLVFSVNKEYYNNVKDVSVIGVYNHHKINLTVNDLNNFITNELASYYYTNDQIEIETDILMDASLELYVNDKFHSTPESFEENGQTKWRFTVTAFSDDLTISFKVVDGFLLADLFFVETFASSDYGYQNVYQYAETFSMEYLEIKYGITEETEQFLIETWDDYEDIRNHISYMVSEPIIDEPIRYVWLYIKREANASNFIKINYRQEGYWLAAYYNLEFDEGDSAIFTCIDLVRIEYNIYQELEKDENGQIIISDYQNQEID